MIIDSHCHASPLWYEPVETLLFQMDRAGVERAVLIQMLGQFDNSYQQDCVARYPDRLASVVGVNAALPDAAQTLRRMAESGVCGVRLRPEVRSSGEDPLAIWRAAAECRLAVSCIGPVTGFCTAEFAALLTELPGLSVVLEHLGGLARPDAGNLETAAPQLFELARFKNLYLKVPGLGQLAARQPSFPISGSPLAGDPSGWIRQALEHFGAGRLMWGSDFPPVASREGYQNALRWPRQALQDQPESTRTDVFGGVAGRVFFAL